jgi:hypothetical protein
MTGEGLANMADSKQTAMQTLAHLITKHVRNKCSNMCSIEGTNTVFEPWKEFF